MESNSSLKESFKLKSNKVVPVIERTNSGLNEDKKTNQRKSIIQEHTPVNAILECSQEYASENPNYDNTVSSESKDSKDKSVDESKIESNIDSEISSENNESSSYSSDHCESSIFFF